MWAFASEVSWHAVHTAAIGEFTSVRESASSVPAGGLVTGVPSVVHEFDGVSPAL